MATTTNPILTGRLTHDSAVDRATPIVDLAALRAYRLARVQQQLRAHD